MVGFEKHFILDHEITFIEDIPRNRVNEGHCYLELYNYKLIEIPQYYFVVKNNGITPDDRKDSTTEKRWRPLRVLAVIPK